MQDTGQQVGDTFIVFPRYYADLGGAAWVRVSTRRATVKIEGREVRVPRKLIKGHEEDPFSLAAIARSHEGGRGA